MFKRYFPEREEGFSIVELMVVLLILGILIGIVTASFVFSVRTSKETACKSNLRIIREQLTLYYQDYGEFPPSLQDLVPDYIEGEKCLFCPESGEAYDYDPGTGEVACPYHTDY